MAHADLQDLQMRVFNQAMSPDDVAQLLPGTVAINQQDFANLFRELIQRGQAETVWNILRFYGYDDGLQLDAGYLHPKLDIKADGSEVIELSQDGWNFLVELFHKLEKVGNYMVRRGVVPLLKR